MNEDDFAELEHLQEEFNSQVNPATILGRDGQPLSSGKAHLPEDDDLIQFWPQTPAPSDIQSSAKSLRLHDGTLFPIGQLHACPLCRKNQKEHYFFRRREEQ